MIEMNTVKKYTHSADEIIETFNTLEELLDIPFIADWKKDNGFYRYSVGRDLAYRMKLTLMLIAEFDDGYRWFVIGFLDDDITELPQFVKKKRKKEIK